MLELRGARARESPPKSGKCSARGVRVCVCECASVSVWGECGLHGGSVPFKSFFSFFVSAAVAVGCCAYAGVRMA